MRQHDSGYSRWLLLPLVLPSLLLLPVAVAVIAATAFGGRRQLRPLRGLPKLQVAAFGRYGRFAAAGRFAASLAAARPSPCCCRGAC